MEIDQRLKTEFDACGRVWLRNAISDSDLLLFDDAALINANAGQRLGPSSTLTSALGHDGSLAKAIRNLDANAKPVRVVAFNKSPNANWGVPWHQDRVIAVEERAEVDGFTNWTMKKGAWHCEPPQTVLNRMMFVRVHLDDTNRSNGAMQIAVGSHVNGIVPSASAKAEVEKYPLEFCEAKRGDVLVLKMLTLHSSEPATILSGRRVLRVDFSSDTLPKPLIWPQLDGEFRTAE